MNKKDNIKKRIGDNKKMISIGFIIGIIIFCYWQNNDIVVTNIQYRNKYIPKSFNGYKILHVSDLHNKEFGKGQKNLIKHTRKINPNAIVITGDLIDSRKTDVKEFNVFKAYLSEAIKIAPIYYVSGNHEQRSAIYNELREELKAIGVINLDDSITSINIAGESIGLIGLSDIYSMGPDYMNEESKIKFKQKLLNIKSKSENKFNILLSHRPELIDIYASSNADLVFSGHAHGGQVRIPYVVGLIAPSQGLIPKYTDGIHTVNNTSMIISRGLGNSLIPIRVFNRPELVVTTLSR